MQWMLSYTLDNDNMITLVSTDLSASWVFIKSHKNDKGFTVAHCLIGSGNGRQVQQHGKNALILMSQLILGVRKDIVATNLDYTDVLQVLDSLS